MSRLNKCLVLMFLGVLLTQCTSDFNDINVRPDAFTSDEVSGKFFLTQPQYKLFAPDRYPYWRAHLIHTDRYAGHFTFGFRGCWWSDGLGYTYNSGYTDAAWDWLEGYIGNLDNYMRNVKQGGEFENQYMEAIGLVMRGLYFQMFTDVFGMVAYSEATNPDITQPKFDEQAVIYKGLIDELDRAMSLIGDAERTGVTVDDVGENDLYYGGDLQKWKKLANTLKLRLAMRALGAPGADFAEGAITQALGQPLLETEADNCLLPKDEIITQWDAACYGDVWYNFGTGSDWTVGKTLIDYLRNNEDPRLALYAKPARGGEVFIEKPDGPEAAQFDKRVDFIAGVLDEAGVAYTREDTEEGTTIVMPENTYYVGQPTRLNAETYSMAAYEFFSTPAEIVIRAKNSGEIFPELVLVTAQSYFLQAEAAVRGLSNGDAAALYQDGIRYAMKLWGVPDADIDKYLADAPLAQLTGTTEEMIEKIAIQRWIASYTDGFEGWAIVRDYGYPAELAAGVEDPDIYSLGDAALNGKYPQRLRYGNNAVNTNGPNVQAAIAKQGPDEQSTKLWWAK
ncbi:MAG: SusD/RagB family nutrient-binding outer membrane lipoprotein [Phaeodactylibacter sp.]|nr:SusD/RagB family nutrient-binding outer membrane lipoprotein [Phaeodactylibacter sp.]